MNRLGLTLGDTRPLRISKKKRTTKISNNNNIVVDMKYQCTLCTYKTNLKQNYNTHCNSNNHMLRKQLDSKDKKSVK